MPRISVLQLDTHFPRIAGDVGCADTYQCDLEIIRVPAATVNAVVTDAPDQIDPQPFVDAIKRASGDLITTSCGFLAPLHATLAAHSDVTFIASALDQLTSLQHQFTPAQLQIITFDAAKLGRAHLPDGCSAFATAIRGLDAASHLRDVITHDRANLDVAQATQDVCDAVGQNTGAPTQAILLECTNLPPYKSAIRQINPVPIYDILTAIEAQMPNAIQPRYL